MKQSSSLFALFFLALVLFFASPVFAGEGSGTLTVLREATGDWIVAVSTEQVIISYQKVENDDCIGYRLRIENRTNEIRTVQFGVMGALLPECKSMYKTYNDFQFRTIVLRPNETLSGENGSSNLLITRWANQELPPLEVVIQNLTIQ